MVLSDESLSSVGLQRSGPLGRGRRPADRHGRLPGAVPPAEGRDHGRTEHSEGIHPTSPPVPAGLHRVAYGLAPRAIRRHLHQAGEPLRHLHNRLDPGAGNLRNSV